MAGGKSRIEDDEPPVGAVEFAALMRPFEPFEGRPRLAVAVSGGRDSLALALLAREWVRTRGGELVALVVDHALRPESAAEAEQVRLTLASCGIEAHVFRLRWQRRPSSGLQEAARARRYRILRDWCGEQGVLHLLLAHQADDQAETYVLRKERDSGPDGLAGMSACVEFPEVRVLRPLLPVPRARLSASLKARRQPWIDDPSNEDPAYRRARLRIEGLPSPRDSLLRRVDQAAAKRVVNERAVADALVELAQPHPLGAIYLDPDALRSLPKAVAAQALSRIVATVSGGEHEPRGDRLVNALEHLRAKTPKPGKVPAEPPPGTTVGGCRIVWRGNQWLVVREAASIHDHADWRGDASVEWDGRFLVGERIPTGGLGSLTDEWTGRHGVPGRGWQTEAILRLYPLSMSQNLRRAQLPTVIANAYPVMPLPEPDVARWRPAAEAAWPATKGLSVILAGSPAVRWDERVVPLVLRSAAAALVQPMLPTGGESAASPPIALSKFLPVAVFRPRRPLLGAPFFPCFAADEAQLVKR
ncbi:MAG: tRNA lysidine(34) synthetase TilS [Alphaproteobacteria bacterium]|nr:tRNA lysidine(34) synthetase TilS [Alphaproteobacteria bacterium]